YRLLSNSSRLASSSLAGACSPARAPFDQLGRVLRGTQCQISGHEICHTLPSPTLNVCYAYYLSGKHGPRTVPMAASPQPVKRTYRGIPVCGGSKPCSRLEPSDAFHHYHRSAFRHECGVLQEGREGLRR